jgi:hypothetical protein
MEKQVGTAQAASAYAVQEQEPPKSQAPTPQAGAATPASPASQGNQAPAQAAAAAKGDAGYIEPAQLKALLHKIWLAEYRTNDLLTEVHPERWKISNDARKSFNQTLENLRKALASQEDWRAQFEKRPDSAYVGYETFVAISAVLPRLDALARGVSQYENRSLGAQYSQAENQLFDLQQALQAPLEYMVRNQDQLLLAAQTNLASCQSQLGFAMRPRTESATPIKTYIPEIKGHGRVFYTGETYPGSNTPPQAAPRPTGEKKAQKKTEKKPEAKQAAEKKAGEKRKPSAAGEAKAATPPEKPKK